jgi:hypothetical protein
LGYGGSNVRRICALLATTIAPGCLNESNHSNFFDQYAHWQFRMALPTQETPADVANIVPGPLELGVAWVSLGAWNTIFYPLVEASTGDQVELVSPLGNDFYLGEYSDYVFRNDSCTPQCCGAAASTYLNLAIVAPSERMLDPSLSPSADIEVCVDGLDECATPTSVEVWQVGCFLDPDPTCTNHVLDPDSEGAYRVGPFRLALTVDTDGCPVAE